MSHVQLITCIHACIALTLKCEIMDLSTQIRRTIVTGRQKPHGVPREKIKREKKRKGKKTWWYRFLWPHPLLMLTGVPKANNYNYYIEIWFLKFVQFFNFIR